MEFIAVKENVKALLAGCKPVIYDPHSLAGIEAKIYNITPDVAIVTGYDPIGGIVPDEKTIRTYNNSAMIILGFTGFEKETISEMLNENLQAFIHEVIVRDRIKKSKGKEISVEVGDCYEIVYNREWDDFTVVEPGRYVYPSFDTLKGACEHAYYQCYRDSKI